MKRESSMSTARSLRKERCSTTARGGGNRLRLVQAQDGALVRQVNRQQLATSALRPDGGMLVGVLRDGGIQGLSLADGAALFGIHPPQIGQRFDRSDRSDEADLAFTPDGKRFAGVVTLPDGRQAMQVWDAATGIPLQSLRGGSGRVRDVTVHPLSSGLLVSGANSKAWDFASRVRKRRLLGGGRHRLRAHSQQGQRAALQKLEPDRTTLLWKPPTGELHLFSETADGRFATASGDLNVKLLDLYAGKQLRELRGPTTSPVRLNFSRSGKHLICASINDAMRIWEIE